ncbi:hypothetical protein BH11ARM2_BH11ARM2_00480 [soil metagenome]
MFPILLTSALGLLIGCAGDGDATTPAPSTDVTPSTYESMAATGDGRTADLRLSVDAEGTVTGTLSFANGPAQPEVRFTVPNGSYSLAGTANLSTGSFRVSGTTPGETTFTVKGTLPRAGNSGSYTATSDDGNFTGTFVTGGTTGNSNGTGTGATAVTNGDTTATTDGNTATTANTNAGTDGNTSAGTDGSTTSGSTTSNTDGSTTSAGTDGSTTTTGTTQSNTSAGTDGSSTTGTTQSTTSAGTDGSTTNTGSTTTGG